MTDVRRIVYPSRAMVMTATRGAWHAWFATISNRNG